jgi:imidazolonepropionase-like amidohydrolase
MAQSFSITGATVIDGTGSLPIRDAVIVVRNGTITQCGPRSEVSPPPDSDSYDATGRYVLPGLIDLHVHVNHHGFIPWPVEASPDCFAGIVGANNLRSALQNGITTARDAGGESHMNLAMRTALQRRVVVGPRLLVVGTGICMTGGHGSQHSGTSKHQVDGPWEIRKAVRTEVKAGADWIKLLTTHRTDFPEFSLDEIRAAVDEAHRLGRRVAIHAANEASTQAAAVAGVDTIEHGCFIDEATAGILADKGITVVPTIWVHNYLAQSLRARLDDAKEAATRPKDVAETLLVETIWFERCAQQLPKTIALLREKGVHIATGTDNVFPDQPFAPLAQEIRLLSENGLSPMEAIEAATRVAAEALDMQDEIGTVEAGKRADLIMVDRDPLEDIHALEHVSWVMQGGSAIPLYPEWPSNRAAGEPLSLPVSD